jgi:hypothetical protein
MLKRDITYENFDGEKVTETFYFNLTKSEIVELEVGYDEGLQEVLQRIIKTENRKRLIEEFKRIILLSYGERSEDGKRFVKNDQLREGFAQTAAYDALFIELATNEESAAVFIKGIIPKDFAQEVEKAEVVKLPALAKD